ncbi:HNH endonuclease signature motif containing protein [Microbacterium sp. USTB-Y]|uniref:HNH endonuclease signature motif containing protein n=1 Tax=Microbacterium sp. USTB-Y TaxID=2823692 RepID=UPI00203EDD12|nr:HNH endonuclease signature motif containing protein [Microbacterium sp. USTB-Y]
MTSTTREVLEQVEHLLRGMCASDEVVGQFEGIDDAEAIRILQACGRVQRLIDAGITTVAARAAERDLGPASSGISTRAGCANVTELLRRALRVDVGTARRYLHAADAVRRDLLLSSGQHAAARFEALGRALRDGDLSVTGLLAAVGPVERSGNRIDGQMRDAVDEILAAMARGADLPDEHGRPGPAPSTDELAHHARALMLALDPDGAEPEDRRAERNRGITIGRLRDGVRPVRGGLLPEVAAVLERLFDAFNNPAAPSAADLTGRLDPTGDGARAGVRFVDDTEAPDASPFPGGPAAPADTRTRAQRDHDNLAAILNIAAGRPGVPALGGAAPTLVVSVTAKDYATGSGRAFLEGSDIDVPLSVARHTACAGGIQRVLFDDHGQIVSIGTTARVFTALQRRAIVLRDRECLIPGCHTPAAWCEIHHVQEHAAGGPTHTSNGVALCWQHHRTLETSGWQIRMRRGVPELRGPHWWDPARTWFRPRTRGGLTDALHRAPADALAPPG